MKAMPIGRSARYLGGGRVRIAAGCAAAALLLAGCSALGGSSTSGSAAVGSSITVAAVPGVGDARLYVGLQHGLFRQHGITVHVRSCQTVAPGVDALHHGQGDLAAGLTTPAVAHSLITEPQIVQAESEIGARTILDACSGVTVNLPLDGYFAPKSFAEKNQAALLAFRSVMPHAQADSVQPAPL